MCSNTEIDKENIIPSTYEHLPEDVRLLLRSARRSAMKKTYKWRLRASRSIDAAKSPRSR